MLFCNAHIEKENRLQDIRISSGKFLEIADRLVPFEGEDVVDLDGKLVLPPFIESHIHLDSALLMQESESEFNGTLFDGIKLWSEKKEKLTHEDVKKRAIGAIRLEASHGVQYIRTHVDICDERLIALHALQELKRELRGIVEIQIVGFPQEGILSFPKGKELVRNAVNEGVDAIGAIPHYEYTREYATESLNFIMKLAEEKGLLVDVHCDETDDESSRGLETLAARAIESGMFDRVTASHTTAMHSYSNAYVGRLIRTLKKSQINFIANPLVNISLQGRYDSYPRRRGMTRVKELTEAGLNVSFGHDDIRDPWYSMGTGNLMDVVHMGLHVEQMLSRKEIEDSYKFVTYNAAKTLHISKEYGIAVGNNANMIVLNANNFYNALANRAEVLYSIRGGKVIVKNSPVKNKLFF